MTSRYIEFITFFLGRNTLDQLARISLKNKSIKVFFLIPPISTEKLYRHYRMSPIKYK